MAKKWIRRRLLRLHANSSPYPRRLLRFRRPSRPPFRPPPHVPAAAPWQPPPRITPTPARTPSLPPPHRLTPTASDITLPVRRRALLKLLPPSPILNRRNINNDSFHSITSKRTSTLCNNNNNNSMKPSSKNSKLNSGIQSLLIPISLSSIFRH